MSRLLAVRSMPGSSDGLVAEVGPQQARALRVGQQRAGVKRIDQQRVRIGPVVAVRQAADQEMPWEVHALHGQPRPARDVDEHQRQRDRDARATRQHVVQQAVARVVVLLVVADEAKLPVDELGDDPQARPPGRRAAKADLEVVARGRAHLLKLAQKRRRDRAPGTRRAPSARRSAAGCRRGWSPRARTRRPGVPSPGAPRLRRRPGRWRPALEPLQRHLRDVGEHAFGLEQGVGRIARRQPQRPQPGGARRPQTPSSSPRWRPRVRDRSACRGARDICSTAAAYGSGAGLPLGVSPAATMTGTTARRPAPSRICSISCAQCARCDRDRHGRGHRRHAVGGAVETAPGRRAPVAGRSRSSGRSAQPCGRRRCRAPCRARAPRTRRRRRCRGIARSTRLPKAAGLPGRGGLVDPKVQRLAVGDHPVEVEDHALQRHFTFSPARIGTCRRLARGG